MRAAIFKGAGKPLAIEHVPDPMPGPDDLVIKVGRCGICGTDLHRTEGHEGQTFPIGAIMGHEFAGEVVSLGRDVQGFKLGDRVSAMPFSGCGTCNMCLAGDMLFCKAGARPMMGGYAEYMCIGAGETLRLPAMLSMEDGALVEPLAVGLQGVERAGLKKGDRVLVLGAGPIGLAAIFWAKQRGAKSILAVASTRRREKMARELGATDFLILGENPAAEIISSLGGEPDIVFEAVGLPGTIAQSIDLVRHRGTVMVLGLCLQPESFFPIRALRKEVQMIFSMAYSLPVFQSALDALAAGHLEPRAMITQTVNLTDFPAAFEALRGPSPQCKVMLDPWRS